MQETAALSKVCEVQVVAPIHFITVLMNFFKQPDKRQLLTKEVIEGIIVSHPLLFVTPKIFRCLHGVLYFLSVFWKIKTIKKSFDFDLIYCHWIYPDGVAAVLLGKSFKRPVILHALGCDINFFTEFMFRRFQIKWAMNNSTKTVAVSHALKQKIIELGIPVESVTVIHNGVDAQLFKPLPKLECRAELNIPKETKMILFIGRLEEEKGIQDLIRAAKKIKERYGREFVVYLLGDGGLKPALLDLIQELRLETNVRLIGEIAHQTVPKWLNAADVFCLPSLREGLPNVLLEAKACRVPIVATNVGGIPEIVSQPADGTLVPPQDPSAMAEALLKVISKNRINQELARSDGISWERVAQALKTEFPFPHRKLELN